MGSMPSKNTKTPARAVQAKCAPKANMTDIQSLTPAQMPGMVSLLLEQRGWIDEPAGDEQFDCPN